MMKSTCGWRAQTAGMTTSSRLTPLRYTRRLRATTVTRPSRRVRCSGSGWNAAASTAAQAMQGSSQALMPQMIRHMNASVQEPWCVNMAACLTSVQWLCKLLCRRASSKH